MKHMKLIQSKRIFFDTRWSPSWSKVLPSLQRKAQALGMSSMSAGKELDLEIYRPLLGNPNGELHNDLSVENTTGIPWPPKNDLQLQYVCMYIYIYIYMCIYIYIDMWWYMIIDGCLTTSQVWNEKLNKGKNPSHPWSFTPNWSKLLSLLAQEKSANELVHGQAQNPALDALQLCICI